MRTVLARRAGLPSPEGCGVGFTAYERRFVAQTPRARIAPPPPRAFDRAQALRTFDRVTKRAYVTPDWADAQIPPVVSRDEATFWLYAISGINAARRELLALRTSAQRHAGVDHDEARAHARAELERLDDAQPPSRAEIARRLAALAGPTWGEGSYREVVIALAALLDLPALLETILDEANADAAAALAADSARRMATFEANRGIITFSLSFVTGDEPGVAEHARAGSGAELVAAAPDTAFAALRELRRGDGVAQRAWLTHTLAAGFADYVAPFLDDASFEHTRAVVHAAVHHALARPPFSVARSCTGQMCSRRRAISRRRCTSPATSKRSSLGGRASSHRDTAFVSAGDRVRAAHA